MSKLDDYVEGAVSTESTIDEVKVNKQFLTQILSMDIELNLSNIFKSTHDELEDAESTLDIDPRIFHAVLGAATESVELLEALEFNGKEMDLVNLGEEFGDLNWYQAIFCDAAGIKWDDILDTNADKLFKKKEARYKDGFSDKDANERNLTAERKVLDTLKIKTS